MGNALPNCAQTPRERAALRLAFALDFPAIEDALAFLKANSLGGRLRIAKVGLELFTSAGPRAVQLLHSQVGCEVFLDLKLHDIPETVERAVGAACQLGVRYLTVHASGGPKMLEKAARRAEREATGLQLLAITVLTSLDAEDLARTGVVSVPSVQAARLARLAFDSGVRGVVCSAAEVALLRSDLGPDAVLVTPGIRPAGADAGDQKRVVTPGSAVRDGASILVVGRPIRDSVNPSESVNSILGEIEEAS